jgi:SAM-dependent MidA family methyltransferase
MQPLFELIRREIVARDVLPFARFMELALHCPDYGFYEVKKDNPGRRGDFYTSVSVGDLFGQLLAFQFAKWLETEIEGLKSLARIVEVGAHDGKLAGDILAWLQTHRSKLFNHIEYCIVEPSARRQEWQKEMLQPFAPRVRWAASLQELAGRDGVAPVSHPSLSGVIFSNELLDAMPVHRFGWDASTKKWFEWGVALEGDKFIWARCPDFLAPPSGERARQRSVFPSSIFHLPSLLLDVLPDGYIVEISSIAEKWWRDAASVLEHGRLMTIDYGLGADELFSPGRLNGTLRAYFRHHFADDMLANVGEQDLTAHVNFPAIQAAGESAGLKTESFSTQTQFLTRILDDATKDESLGDWNASRTRQFQTLTHPEHFGRAFRVLVQSR